MSQPVTYESISRNSEDERKFISEIAISAGGLALAIHLASLPEGTIATEFTTLHDALSDLYRSLAQPRKRTAKSKSWWNEDCEEAFSDHRRHRSVETKRILKGTIHQAKRKYFDSVLQRLGETRRPWDALSWIGARPPPRRVSPITADDGSSASTEEQYEILHSHFSREAAIGDIDLVEEILDAKDVRPWIPISAKEVRDIITAAHSSSAPGGDHMSWTYLKKALSAHEDFSADLATIFSALVETKSMPDCLKYAETVIIPKPNKPDYSKPKAWRPIALLSCLSKTLMGVIAKRMQYEAHTYSLTHPNQYGGLMGRASVDAGLTAAQRMADGQARGVYTSILAIDIAQFFPSIKHEILLKILERQGFSPNVVGFIGSYLVNRTTRYHLGESVSQTFDFNVGVPQGCKISPILACLYLAPALWHLDKPEPESPHFILSFVDDTAICTQSRNLDANVAWLVHQYTRWKACLLSFGLRIEDDKTELFHTRAYQTEVHRKPLYNGPLPDVKIQGDGGQITIKATERWRYLGFIFDSCLNYRQHLEWWTNKAQSTLVAMKMLGNSARGLTPKDKRLMYLTAVFPVMAYGFQLWYRHKAKKRITLMKKLSVVQHAAAKWITGGFRTSPSGALEMIAGLSPIRINLDKRYIRASVRLGMLQEGLGIRTFRLPPLSWDVPTMRTIRITRAAAFLMPPFSKARSCGPGPIDALESATPLLWEPLSYHHLNSPGLRVTDIYPDRFRAWILPPRREPLDRWARGIEIIVEDHADHPTFFVLASPPGNIHKRSGAFGFVLHMPHQQDLYASHPCDATNHHELSLAGIVDCLRHLEGLSGHVSVLARNQAAISTILDSSHKVNRHYARTADQILRKWFSRDINNTITLGWIPKEYTPYRLEVLRTRLRISRITRTTPITHQENNGLRFEPL
jgi:hypothetical protein